MKSHLTSLWLLTLLLLCGSLSQTTAQPVPHLSNFGNQWPGGGIGDIHGYPAQPIIARFTTGSRPVELNAVSLEFLSSPGFSNWDGLEVQVRPSYSGAQWLRLVNPAVNPLPTQWPSQPGAQNFTVYVDFHPTGVTHLPAQTSFEVSIRDPFDGPPQAPMLYTASNSYNSLDGWSMGPTSINNPFAEGQFLKLAVYATPVPEPRVTILLFSVLLLFAARKCVGN